MPKNVNRLFQCLNNRELFVIYLLKDHCELFSETQEEKDPNSTEIKTLHKKKNDSLLRK